MYKEITINKSKVSTTEFLSRDAMDYIIINGTDVRNTYKENSYHIIKSRDYYLIKNQFGDIVGCSIPVTDVESYIMLKNHD